jgi:hypothetical protein
MPRKNQRGRDDRLPLACAEKLGLIRSMSLDVSSACSLMSLPEAVLIAIGTSWILSSRLYAVTTTSERRLLLSPD